MKDFKSYLNEQHPANNYSMHDSDYNLVDISDDVVVRRLNSFLGNISNMEHMMPEQLVYTLRNRLETIGISFPKVDNSVFNEDSGEVSMPLSQYGGRFGKDLDTPHNEFLNDDGISHVVEEGLSLHISYEKTDTNQCRLRAHIE